MLTPRRTDGAFISLEYESITRFGKRANFKLAFELMLWALLFSGIAFFAAWGGEKYSDDPIRARDMAATADLADLKPAIESFHRDTGRYPSTKESLDALLDPPAGAQGWNGPYLSRRPQDPWGNSYVYRYAGTHGSPYLVKSAGPDGQADTSDDLQ